MRLADTEERKRRPIVGQFKKDLIEKHGTRCKICGSDGPINWHHIIPFSCGGPDTVDNIIPLCEQCHAQVHHKGMKENHKKLGRRRKECLGQDIVFQQYITGRIEGKDAVAMLGYSSNVHMADIPAFKEYCARNHIERIPGLNFGRGGRNPEKTRSTKERQYGPKKKIGIKKYSDIDMSWVDAKETGKKIYWTRIGAGITKQKMVSLLGGWVTYDQIDKWETGEIKCPAGVIVRMATAMNMKPEDLIAWNAPVYNVKEE